MKATARTILGHAGQKGGKELEQVAHPKKGHAAMIFWTAISFIAGIIGVWLYFRYQHYTSGFIHSLGPYGVIAAIVLMALLCIVPFPAEFLMVIDMQAYGVWKGIFYVWVGAMIGSYVTFLLAKRFGEKWLKRFIAPHYVEKIDEAVRTHGAVGLLMARLIPFIPFVVLNYVSAMVPQVRTRTYLWTTGLGIIPYDLAAALIFLGFSKKLMIWLIVGAIAVVGIWILAMVRTRKARLIAGGKVHDPKQGFLGDVTSHIFSKKRSHI